MPTNYELLKSSEKELYEMFLKFVHHCYFIHQKLWEGLSHSDDNFLLLFNEINDLENISDNFEKDILDECIWIISKDQPRANHLRFIISIIYSTKDLERISDYALNIIAIFNKLTCNNIDKNIFNILSSKYLDTFKKMVILIEKNTIDSTYDEAIKIKSDFFNWYKENIKLLFELKINDNFKKYVFSIVKAIDKTIDHIFNVLSNMMYIKRGR